MDVKSSNPDWVWNENGLESASMVRNHIDNIYKKVGVRNRLKLINPAQHKRKIISPRHFVYSVRGEAVLVDYFVKYHYLIIKS
jgi:hypothetical protein